MIANKIILCLKSFQTKEMKALEAFLQSPYCNKNPKCLSLFKILKEHWPNDFDKLEKSTLEQKLFPTKIGGSNLSVLIVDLFQKIKKFIVLEELEKQEDMQAHLLQKGFLNRELTHLSGLHFKELERKGQFILASRVEQGLASSKGIELGNKRQLGREDLCYQLLLCIDYSLFYEQNKQAQHAVAIPEILERLEAFYLGHRLLYSYELLNREVLNGQPLNKKLLQNLLAHVENPPKQPLLKMLHLSLQIMAATDPAPFIQQQQKMLKTERKQIKIKDLNEIYAQLINHYYRAARKSDFEQNLRAILQIYQLQLENGHLDKQHPQFPQRLKNIVATACYLKEFETAKAVLFACKDSLKAEIRAATFGLNLATIYFYQNKQLEALQALDLVGKIDDAYIHDRPFMQLKIYYELIAKDSHYFDLLESQARSFKEFIRTNKKVSKENRRAYTQVTALLIRLGYLRLQLKNKAMDKVKIRSKLEKLKEQLIGQAVVQKEWLLQKVEEM